MAAEDRPPSRASDAYRVIRDRIVTCRLTPGQRVTEKQLADELGFGLTPVRQALVRLSAEELIRALPRRGYQVAPLTIESVNELFQVWRIVGPAIAELAGPRIPASERERLTAEHNAAFAAARKNRDAYELLEASQALWTVMAEAAGNARLAQLYYRVLGELRRVFSLVFQDTSALDALAGFGDGQVVALLGEPGEARAATEKFIDTARFHVLGILASWPSVRQAEVTGPPPGA